MTSKGRYIYSIASFLILTLILGLFQNCNSTDLGPLRSDGYAFEGRVFTGKGQQLLDCQGTSPENKRNFYSQIIYDTIDEKILVTNFIEESVGQHFESRSIVVPDDAIEGLGISAPVFFHYNRKLEIFELDPEELIVYARILNANEVGSTDIKMYCYK